MRQPNLLIIGAQKCGTTWLHYVLKKSKHLHGSRVKEVNYWNKKSRGSFEDYCKHFDDASGEETYFYESTPHYFRLPRGGFNISHNIRDGLGDIPLILMLRNPVDRYLSAATHHMMMGRMPWADELNVVDTRFGMLTLGYYRQIYDVFAKDFSNIHTFLYEDMLADKTVFIRNLMATIGLKNDIKPRYLNVVLNSKVKKMRRQGDIRPLPKLSAGVRQELADLYRNDVMGMQDVLKRDLSHWLRDPVEHTAELPTNAGTLVC